MTENEILENALKKVEVQQDNFGFMDRFDVEEHWAVRKALEEIQQYRAIGTIEEFKDLKEKSVVKKPRFYAHNYYCTECGNLVGNNEFEWQRLLYCDKCGQKLDWQ